MTYSTYAGLKREWDDKGFNLPAVPTNDDFITGLNNALLTPLNHLIEQQALAQSLRKKYATRSQRDRVYHGLMQDNYYWRQSEDEKADAKEFRIARNEIFSTADRYKTEALNLMHRNIQGEINRHEIIITEANKKIEENKKTANDAAFQVAQEKEIKTAQQRIATLDKYYQDYRKEVHDAIEQFTAQQVHGGLSNRDLKEIRENGAELGWSTQEKGVINQGEARKESESTMRFNFRGSRGTLTIVVTTRQDVDPETKETVTVYSMPRWVLTEPRILSKMKRTSSAQRKEIFSGQQEKMRSNKDSEYGFNIEGKRTLWVCQLLSEWLEVSLADLMTKKEHAIKGESFDDFAITDGDTIEKLEETRSLSDSERKTLLTLKEKRDEIRTIEAELFQIKTQQIFHAEIEKDPDDFVISAQKSVVATKELLLAVNNHVAEAYGTVKIAFDKNQDIGAVAAALQLLTEAYAQAQTVQEQARLSLQEYQAFSKIPDVQKHLHQESLESSIEAVKDEFKNTEFVLEKLKTGIEKLTHASVSMPVDEVTQENFEKSVLSGKITNILKHHPGSCNALASILAKADATIDSSAQEKLLSDPSSASEVCRRAYKANPQETVAIFNAILRAEANRQRSNGREKRAEAITAIFNSQGNKEDVFKAFASVTIGDHDIEELANIIVDADPSIQEADRQKSIDDQSAKLKDAASREDELQKAFDADPARTTEILRRVFAENAGTIDTASNPNALAANTAIDAMALNLVSHDETTEILVKILADSLAKNPHKSYQKYLEDVRKLLQDPKKAVNLVQTCLVLDPATTMMAFNLMYQSVSSSKATFEALARLIFSVPSALSNPLFTGKTLDQIKKIIEDAAEPTHANHKRVKNLIDKALRHANPSAITAAINNGGDVKYEFNDDANQCIDAMQGIARNSQGMSLHQATTNFNKAFVRANTKNEAKDHPTVQAARKRYFEKQDAVMAARRKLNDALISACESVKAKRSDIADDEHAIRTAAKKDPSVEEAQKKYEEACQACADVDNDTGVEAAQKEVQKLIDTEKSKNELRQFLREGLQSNDVKLESVVKNGIVTSMRLTSPGVSHEIDINDAMDVIGQILQEYESTLGVFYARRETQLSRASKCERQITGDLSRRSGARSRIQATLASFEDVQVTPDMQEKTINPANKLLAALKNDAALTQMMTATTLAEKALEKVKQQKPKLKETLTDSRNAARKRIAKSAVTDKIVAIINSTSKEGDEARKAIKAISTLVATSPDAQEAIAKMLVRADYSLKDAKEFTNNFLEQAIAEAVAAQPHEAMILLNSIYQKQSVPRDSEASPQHIMEIIQSVGSGIDKINEARQRAYDEWIAIDPTVKEAYIIARSRLLKNDPRVVITDAMLNQTPEVQQAKAQACFLIFEDKPNVSAARNKARERLIELGENVSLYKDLLAKNPNDAALQKQLAEAQAAVIIDPIKIEDQIEVVSAICEELDKLIKKDWDEVVEQDDIVTKDRKALEEAEKNIVEAQKVLESVTAPQRKLNALINTVGNSLSSNTGSIRAQQADLDQTRQSLEAIQKRDLAFTPVQRKSWLPFMGG